MNYEILTLVLSLLELAKLIIELVKAIKEQ